MNANSISKNMSETPALLVVGGTQRGGTTLLMRFLITHPAINLFPFDQRSLGFYDLATYLHVIAVSKVLFARFSRLYQPDIWRYTLNYVSNILKQTSIFGFVTLDTIHNAMIGALANKDTKYVGAKYPAYLLDYPQFIHRENTKCIFIYRDARDFTASNLMRVRYDWWRKRRWIEKINTAEKLSHYWLLLMHCIQDLQQLKANALIIRY
ncbi:MAG: sulfotransferase [Deltaproteobacteria bacterium]|nr:sulfotransferase [Deltaproteobacteria bacterium]